MMASNYMTETVDEFFTKLNRMQSDLEEFSQAIGRKSHLVAQALKSFEEASNTLIEKQRNHQTTENAVYKAQQRAMERVRQAVEGWSALLSQNIAGTEFMKKHEKYLVVMVFGAVKVGKSSLGNFFAGQEFVRAPFDNAYKHCPHPVFEIEEEGRVTGGVTKDAMGNEWFSEGYTDTTGNIQYFTLSGLRWIDSPGTGALGTDGDKVRNGKTMDDLVNAYLPFTDMCIFLLNTSEPGLREDIKYMAELSREEQEAILVITKSDYKDEDEDENGNIIQVLMPKDEKTRQEQQDDMRRRAKEEYPFIDEKMVHSISISTHLACEGIKKANEEKYRSSHLDSLMKILGDKASENVIERKKRNPRRVLNALIKDIVEGRDITEKDSWGKDSTKHIVGLVDFDADLQEMEKSIEKYKKRIEQLSERLCRKIGQSVKRDVRAEARNWNHQVESGTSLDDNVVSTFIQNALQEALRTELNAEMARIIDDYEQQAMPRVQAAIHSSKLERKTATEEIQYVESRHEERDTEGFFEWVRSLFGKKYYRIVHENKVKRRIVDLGTNLDDFLGDLIPQIENMASKEVNENLERLRHSYFAEQEKFLHAMRQEIQSVRKEIEALKL